MKLDEEIFNIHYNKHEIVNTHLKKNEALNDLKIAFILFTTCSISFNFFYESNKEIIQNRYKRLYEQINSKSLIDLDEFINIIKDLGKDIKDMHSYISFLEPQKDTPKFIDFSERLYSYISLKNFTNEQIKHICKVQNLLFSDLEIITKKTKIKKTNFIKHQQLIINIKLLSLQTKNNPII